MFTKRYYISENLNGSYSVIWADLKNLSMLPDNAVRISRKQAIEYVITARNGLRLDGKLCASKAVCPVDLDINPDEYLRKGYIYCRIDEVREPYKSEYDY